MIPVSVDIGASCKVLPPGLHVATFDEIEQRFATNRQRMGLQEGFQRGCKSLEAAGCVGVFLDGSYVTDKPVPGDFDACWDPAGVDPAKRNPVLLDFADRRKNQKMKFGGRILSFLSRGKRHSDLC